MGGSRGPLSVLWYGAPMTINFELVQQLTDRLMDHTLSSQVTAMFDEICCTLQRAGIPWTAGAGHRLLHPQYRNEAIEWTLETGSVIARYVMRPRTTRFSF